MKKFLAGFLAVTFIICMSVGVISAEQQESSVTVDGWGSYVSTGEATVNISPVTYFNHGMILLAYVTVTNHTTPERSYDITATVYQYEEDIYEDNLDNNVRDTAGPYEVDMEDLGDITIDNVVNEATGETYVYFDLNENLERKHSLFVDADSR